MDVVTYRPSSRYQTKLIVSALILFVFLIAVAAPFTALFFSDSDAADPIRTGVLVAAAINLAWLLPTLVIIPPYYRSLRYEIHDDEAIVYAGVITKSVKHVPYRTVTNLKTTRGPLDRLFGIGSLQIQTAGMSGQSGVEESLLGLVELQQAYDLVAQKLRRFRRAMPPTQAGEEEPQAEGPLLESLLAEVQAIRRTLEGPRGDQTS